MKIGKCFACGKDCDKDSYVHDSCALAYSKRNTEEREVKKFIRRLNKIIKQKESDPEILDSQILNEINKLTEKYEL